MKFRTYSIDNRFRKFLGLLIASRSSCARGLTFFTSSRTKNARLSFPSSNLVEISYSVTPIRSPSVSHELSPNL